MDAVTAFEHRKEALRSELEKAADMPGAIRAVTMALEQTAAELLRDEQDAFARQRRQAVLALTARAPQLLRGAKAQAELRVTPAEAPQRERVNALRIAGGLVLAALAFAMIANGKALFAVLQGIGAALLLIPAAQTAPASGQMRAVGVLGVDADALIRAVSELCAAADVCVSDLSLLSHDAAACAVGDADAATLDLLASLMEARATGSGEVALAGLAQAEQRLRELGVEVVYFDRAHAALFDLLPTLGAARTVRPALVRDGKTLRRGVAACPMERSQDA